MTDTVIGYSQAEIENLIGLEQITYRAYRNGDRFYVRSSTSGSKFYQIIDGMCSCKGFMYRSDCQHLKHLEKEGFLLHDINNGGYKMIAEWRRKAKEAERVTTGETQIAGGTDVESRLSQQVSRLQVLSSAQSRLIVAQRRALAAYRNSDRHWIIHRSLGSVDIEQQNLDKVEGLLRSGDKVELDV